MLSQTELYLRAALLRFVRQFFFDKGFLEVDTPIRQPVIIPERYIVPVCSGDWFLQASPELCMKRLLAEGCRRIFQICPCFRGREQGRLHLEEFTMLEWYRTQADYLDLMNDCQELFIYLRNNFLSSFPDLPYNYPESIFHPEANIDLTGDWERLTLKEAFNRFSPLSLKKAVESGSFEELLVEHVEPLLGMRSPTLLYDYPVEQASLARVKDSDPAAAERFELYLKGIELANGFSELTDSREQRRRLKGELQSLEKTGIRLAVPERFLDALDYLDCCAGIALGLDRLFMLILGKKTINEVVTFAPSDL